MYFIRTINFQKISALGLLVRFLRGPRKGSDTTKPGWARALVNLNNSYEERDGTNISNLVGDYLTNTVI